MLNREHLYQSGDLNLGLPDRDGYEANHKARFFMNVATFVVHEPKFVTGLPSRTSMNL